MVDMEPGRLQAIVDRLADGWITSADTRWLLELVADLEEQLRYADTRLSDAENIARKFQAAAGHLGEGLQQAVNVQPLLDRAAALETALQVVAAREVMHAADRERERAIITAARAAVANILDRHPGIGEAQPGWFHESTLALVAAVQGLPAASALVSTDPHAMRASEVVKVRGERDRLAEELERVRGLIRSMEHDHATQQSRWQPQIDELTTERDAASRDRREAELEAAKLREENTQLEAARAEASVAQVQYHAQMRKQITDAHEETRQAVAQRDTAAARADENAREASRVAQELAATQRAKQENDERFQGQIKDLNDQLAVVTASEAIRTVTAYALLREAATALQRPAGQDLGWEQRRDLLARIGTAIGEDLQPELSKAAVHWPPTATPYGGCPANMVVGGRTVWCDIAWPHLPIQSENGNFDHGNLSEGVRWNIDRSGAPSAEPDLRHPWTLGHLRRTVDACPDFADDTPVTATVPSRPNGWAYDGSSYYTHDLLALHIQDPREFL